MMYQKVLHEKIDVSGYRVCSESKIKRKSVSFSSPVLVIEFINRPILNMGFINRGS